MAWGGAGQALLVTARARRCCAQCGVARSLAPPAADGGWRGAGAVPAQKSDVVCMGAMRVWRRGKICSSQAPRIDDKPQAPARQQRLMDRHHGLLRTCFRLTASGGATPRSAQERPLNIHGTTTAAARRQQRRSTWMDHAGSTQRPRSRGAARLRERRADAGGTRDVWEHAAGDVQQGTCSRGCAAGDVQQGTCSKGAGDVQQGTCSRGHAAASGASRRARVARVAGGDCNRWVR